MFSPWKMEIISQKNLPSPSSHPSSQFIIIFVCDFHGFIFSIFISISIFYLLLIFFFIYFCCFLLVFCCCWFFFIFTGIFNSPSKNNLQPQFTIALNLRNSPWNWVDVLLSSSLIYSHHKFVIIWRGVIGNSPKTTTMNWRRRRRRKSINACIN